MSSFDGVNAVTIIFAALCVFAIGYRFYGLFIAAKVLNVDANRVTPAVKYADGQDYVKTDKFVLFGHHFAAIAAAGPLLGPVLAAQFGYLPGLLWILIGCVLAGGVHDMVVLFCSVRHKGRSLAYIATREIDPTTGFVASWAVLAILILTLAGLSIACVNAMHDSLWSTYTVVATIPIAIIMGLYLQIWRKGDVLGATLLGVVLLFLAGLQAVPSELYDAALVDGATPAQKFFYVTLPMIKETFVIVIATLVINAVHVYDIVQGLTNGGPNNATQVLSTYMYTQTFRYNNLGYGAAISIVMVLMMMVIVVPYIIATTKED